MREYFVAWHEAYANYASLNEQLAQLQSEEKSIIASIQKYYPDAIQPKQQGIASSSASSSSSKGSSSSGSGSSESSSNSSSSDESE